MPGELLWSRALFWFLPLCCEPDDSRFGGHVFQLIYDLPTSQLLFPNDNKPSLIYKEI
jgi:hypothetical protein